MRDTHPGALAATHLLPFDRSREFAFVPEHSEPEGRAVCGPRYMPGLGNCVALFAFLQVLDFLTTVIGIRLGIGELSPFIRWLMRAGPVFGLLGAKLIGCALAAVCVWTRRPRTLVRINYFFAGLVLWNLLMICRQILG